MRSLRFSVLKRTEIRIPNRDRSEDQREHSMDSVRYIGLDVHRDTISAAVLDNEGKLTMQSVLATRAAAAILAIE